MKIRFADRMIGAGAFFMTGAMGTAVTGLSAAFGASDATFTTIGFGAVGVAVTAGFVATRVSAKIRSKIGEVIQSAAESHGLGPEVGRLLSEGPRGFAMEELRRARKPETEPAAMAPAPVLSIRSLVEDATRQPALVRDKEKGAPKPMDAPEI